jgi:hypothetical protein
MSGLLGMGGMLSSFNSSKGLGQPDSFDAEMQQKIKMPESTEVLFT